MWTVSDGEPEYGEPLKGWQGDVIKKYNIDAVPTIFVLDENNRIIAKNLRGEKLKAFVSERLK